MGLVEERQDLVAGLELLDASADGFDGACAIGARDDIFFGWKGVFAL